MVQEIAEGFQKSDCLNYDYLEDHDIIKNYGKDKNSLFKAKKPRLLMLCGGWGLVATYCSATGAITSPNRLQTIEIRLPNEDRIVKTVFNSESSENRKFWIKGAYLLA